MRIDNFFDELVFTSGRKGINMRVSKIICFAVGAMLAATAACADETVIVSNLLGPEGPLYIDGNLYYVGWVSHTLLKWDGKTTTVLNHTPGCGQTGWRSRKRRHSCSRALKSMAPFLNST